MVDQNSASLPHEAADWITAPVARFLEDRGGRSWPFAPGRSCCDGWPTRLGPHLSLAFWETPIGLTFVERWIFTRSLRHWINDGLMRFFFFVISLELKREIVLGELRNPRLAALPLRVPWGAWSYRSPFIWR